MKIKIVILLMASVILWSACDDDDNLRPTEGLEKTYSLPQGNHDYDPAIVDWNKRCGVYILYEFEPKDLYWAQTTWVEAVETDGVRSSGILGEPADQDYVGKQLQLVEQHLLKYYPDTILRSWVPLKLLLCSKLEQVYDIPYEWREDLPLYTGVDMMAMNYGNAGIVGMDAGTVTEFRDLINTAMVSRAVNIGKIVIPLEFSRISTYGEYISASTMYKNGFIGNTSQVAKIETDFITYMEAMITKSYEELTRETNPGDQSYAGILHPTKDVNGLIQQKYKIVADYLKEKYNVDLQKIGNER